MSHKITVMTIQKWGNSLAVRIPAEIARKVHFQLGTQVELDANDKDVLSLKATGNKKLSLTERLAAFDPKQHGGEVMKQIHLRFTSRVKAVLPVTS